MRIAHSKNPVLNQSGPSLMNFFETLKKGFLTWIAWMKKVEELKDLGCSVRGRSVYYAHLTLPTKRIV